MSQPSPPTDAARPCPNCRSVGLRALYDVPGIPIQSNLLMATAADALRCPAGDLRLAACPACGFLTNTAFDPATQELSARYEATQGCSATFNAFARSLAAGWAGRYALRGKRALEIGCGHGEFISLLCDVGECDGVGIDPVADPNDAPPGGRVRLVGDYYSEKYADLPADFICCRHTLEHIPQTADFLGMIRRVIGGRAATTVCFEVPDTLRVLREGAFWDLYYEHCSYFTAGSLARVFRAAGFDLLDLRREYDGQYLVLEAKPAPGPTAATLAAEEDAADVADAVAKFPAVCAARLDQWRGVLAAGRRVAVWGSGSKAVGFLTTLKVPAAQVPFVVDINPRKHGTYLPGTGQQIVGPETLTDYHPDVVIVMNPVYRDEIARDLHRLGVGAELLTL